MPKRNVIYNEELVPKYQLPDPFVDGEGRPITTSEAWLQRRRPELLELFKTYVYGHAPERNLPNVLVANEFNGTFPVVGNDRGRRRVIVRRLSVVIEVPAEGIKGDGTGRAVVSDSHHVLGARILYQDAGPTAGPVNADRA